MLQWIRDKLQGFVIRFVAVAITLIFILGAGSYYLFNRNNHGNNKILAKVDGKAINSRFVDNIYYNFIKQHYTKHKSYDKLDLDPKKIKNQILMDLVNGQATIAGLERSGFSITDEQIIGFVKHDPHFQDNGKFSAQKYISLLKKMSLKEAQYRQLLREHLLMEQLRNNILLSNFIPDNEVENFIVKWQQTRNFGYVVIPFKKFIPQVIDDNAIEDYYKKNTRSFAVSETVNVAYLDVTVDKLMSQVKVSKDRLYEYYKSHPEYYTLPELVKVRHILILAPKDIDTQKSHEARAKIYDILAKLKLGQDFIKLAKEYSEDKSSAKNGGDLGWLGKGEIDNDFEQAAFSLKNIGDLSDVVKSKFGYHIIQLLDRRDAKINDFEKAKSQVNKHYKQEEAQAKFENLFDQLSNGVLANEDLAKIAHNFDLEVQSAGPFASNGASSGIASYSEVVMAAFDENNINKNSDPIKLSEDHFVVLRVTNKQPAREKTLLEVREEIKSVLENIAAKQRAKDNGLELAKKLFIAKDPNAVAKLYGVTWNLINAKRDDKNINSEILKAAFSLSKYKMQEAFNLVNGDFAIVQLLSIQDASLQKILTESPNLKNQMQEELIYLQAYLEQKLYEEALFKTAKIKFTAGSSSEY